MSPLSFQLLLVHLMACVGVTIAAFFLCSAHIQTKMKITYPVLWTNVAIVQELMGFWDVFAIFNLE